MYKSFTQPLATNRRVLNKNNDPITIRKAIRGVMETPLKRKSDQRFLISICILISYQDTKSGSHICFHIDNRGLLVSIKFG